MFVITGDQQIDCMETRECEIRSNIDVPKMRDLVMFRFVGSQPLGLHYLDNGAHSSAETGVMRSANLRNAELPAVDCFISPDMRNRQQNQYETPMLHELMRGSGNYDELWFFLTLAILQ